MVQLLTVESPYLHDHPSDGRLSAVWIDGPQQAVNHRPMKTLHFTTCVVQTGALNPQILGYSEVLTHIALGRNEAP